MKKKLIILLVFALFFLTNFNVVVSGISTNVKADLSDSIVKASYKEYTHNNGIIEISSNEEFVNHPAVSAGDGSQQNPYIIEDWKVKQIIISHTNMWFEIKNSYVYDSYAIDFSWVSNGEINNCVLQNDNGFEGILFFWTKNSKITNCVITNYRSPIALRSFSTDNIIHDIEISDCINENEGIVIDGSGKNEFYDCNILNFDYYAFRLEYAYENIIHDCIIQNGGWYGISMTSSVDNVVYCCDISGCDEGIYLENSNDNTIYHNNVYKNRDCNALAAMSSNNDWDNGEEGNYWDDYSGNDKNRNGIGDDEYKIENYVGMQVDSDKYPLIKKYGTPFPPTISGPSKGCAVPNIYSCFFTTKDHNNDKVSYYIDWGDKTEKQWKCDCDPNEETSVGHIYRYNGDYVIRAKAKDDNGMESDWSADFTVAMPKAKFINNNLFSLNLFYRTILEKILFNINSRS